MDARALPILRDLHQHLAEVLALQHAEERARRILQPLDDVLAIFEAARAHPFAGVTQEFSLAAGETREWNVRMELERLAASVVVTAEAELALV